MGSINLSQTTQLYENAAVTISWSESPTITVVATDNTGVTWRIRGKNPDTTEYIVDSSGATGVERTFDAPDGVRDFAFQVYDDYSGSYTNGEFFTVSFDDDETDDDDSGSSSDNDYSSALYQNTLYIKQGEGTKITVERTWSDYGDYTNRDGDGRQVFLSDGDVIYYPADRFVITVEALEGYELDYYDSYGSQIPFSSSNLVSSSSGKYKMQYNSNVTITTTATASSDIGEGEAGSSDVTMVPWGDSTDAGTVTIEAATAPLPGIPKDILAEFPYVVMVLYRYTLSDGTVHNICVAMASTAEWYYYNGTVQTAGEVTTAVLGTLDGETLAWLIPDGATTQAGTQVLIEESDTESTALIYANHDVYSVTEYDADTGEYTTSDIYFAKYDNGTGGDDGEGGDNTGGDTDDGTGGDTNDGTGGETGEESGGDTGDDTDSGNGDDSEDNTGSDSDNETENLSGVYVFRRSTVVGFADQARRLGKVTGELSPEQIQTIFESLSAGSEEVVLDAENVAFASSPIDPDVMYKSGYNWYAQLVALAQEMSGTAKSLTPAQILEEFRRVIYIPQGRAEAEVLNSIFTEETATRNPVVTKAAAEVLLEILAEPAANVRLPVDAPVTAACYETSAGTSLAGTVQVKTGDWVLATVSARSAIACPEGWTLLHETQSLDESNLNQRMAFLCFQATADGTLTVTVGQAESARLYLNLIAVSGIGGFAHHGGQEYITNNAANVHQVEKPEDKTVIWGCTANLWDTSTTHAQWSCDAISANVISLGTDTQARQASFYDNDSGTERRFTAGIVDTAAIIDYVEVLSA